MDLSLASLLVLLACIVAGFVFKQNVGILAIGGAFLLGVIYEIPNKEVLAGFSSSLFITMVGVTYFFAILLQNGAIQKMAQKLVHLVKGNRILIPVIIYFTGALVCAVGPGAIPTLALMPMIAIPIAKSAKMNPIMLSLIGHMGAQSVRMSPLTPEYAVVSDLAANQGIVANSLPMNICLTITELVLMAACWFFLFRKADLPDTKDSVADVTPFDKNQILSLIGMIILVVGVLFFKWNVGLTSFAIGSVLCILGAADEKVVIKAISWNTIMLVIGVGLLMNILTQSGGVDIMVEALQSIMNSRTATGMMGVIAGIMSFFSSGLGVVFPTLVPTAGGIAAGFDGVNAMGIISAIVIGGTVTGFSPISTAGALIMSGVESDDEYKAIYTENDMFKRLWMVAFLGLAVVGLLGLLGVYDFINNIFA